MYLKQNAICLMRKKRIQLGLFYNKCITDFPVYLGLDGLPHHVWKRSSGGGNVNLTIH